MSKGYSNRISSWLRNFGLTGQIHYEDIDEYFKKTNIEYLKGYFANGHRFLYIPYRRSVEDDFRQCVMEMIPAEDYSNDNQSLYLYVKMVECQK